MLFLHIYVTSLIQWSHELIFKPLFSFYCFVRSWISLREWFQWKMYISSKFSPIRWIGRQSFNVRVDNTNSVSICIVSNTMAIACINMPTFFSQDQSQLWTQTENIVDFGRTLLQLFIKMQAKVRIVKIHNPLFRIFLLNYVKSDNS